MLFVILVFGFEFVLLVVCLVGVFVVGGLGWFTLFVAGFVVFFCLCLIACVGLGCIWWCCVWWLLACGVAFVWLVAACASQLV